MTARPLRHGWYRADGTEEALPSKVPYTEVRTGDRFVCCGPAGGGYGDPFERDPQMALDDVLDGYITAATAARDDGKDPRRSLQTLREESRSARIAFVDGHIGTGFYGKDRNL